jgi:hypothetical protein
MRTSKGLNDGRRHLRARTPGDHAIPDRAPMWSGSQRYRPIVAMPLVAAGAGRQLKALVRRVSRAY